MKLVILAAAASLAASPALAAPMSAGEYVTTAGASDLYERTSSQVVLETTKDARVRDFARMMLTAHADSTAQVKAAAQRAGLKPPPPMLTPLQTEMIAQLRAERGPARDAAYVAQQKIAHNGALNVQKAYAMEGTAAPLREAAGKIVPVVEAHIAMLKQM